MGSARDNPQDLRGTTDPIRRLWPANPSSPILRHIPSAFMACRTSMPLPPIFPRHAPIRRRNNTRTIQALLGHSDVKTAMIHAHALNRRPGVFAVRWTDHESIEGVHYADL